MFEGEANETELGRADFSACGPYVRTIVLNDVPAEERNANKFMQQFLSHVLQYCQNVDKINIWNYRTPSTKWGTASALFRDYAPTLRKICWDGEADEIGFADLPKCTKLRIFKYDNINTATLISLLKACGPTLEELCLLISPVGDSAQVIEAIRSNCKKSCVIHIINWKDVLDMVGQEIYCSLIRSFGPQLKDTKVDGLDHEHLVEVVKTCTQSEIALYWKNKQISDWQYDHALGLRIWMFVFSADLLHGSEYPRALKQYANPRQLEIETVQGMQDRGSRTK